MPGAFDRAVREDDVRALRNHDVDNLLGRTKSGTLRLSVDSQGLRYEIDAADDPESRTTISQLRRGDLDGSSFAFQTTDEEWRKEDGKFIREIRGVRLFDVGPVTFPAFEGTTAGVRSNDMAEAKLAYESFKHSRRMGKATYRRRLWLLENPA